MEVLVEDSEDKSRGSDFFCVDPSRVGEEISEFYEQTRWGLDDDPRRSEGGNASGL